MSVPGGITRGSRPEVNVGGGERLARAVATLLVAALTVLAVPALQVPYPLVKIALLSFSELGLVGLLLGMFLKSPTWFAGLELLLAPLAILAFSANGLAWVEVAAGAVAVGAGVSGIVTRRSWLNGLLRIRPFEQIPEVARTEPGRSRR